MTDRKPSLLFLGHNLPYPPDTGARIRSFHTVRLLSQRFEVTVLCFYRRSIRSTPQAVENGIDGLRRFASHVEAFPVPQDSDRLRFVLDHARSVFSRRAYTRWAYESALFRRSLREILKTEPFALAHIDSLDLVAYVPLLQGIPTGCAHHNVESSLLERRAELEGGLRRYYLRAQSALLRREERRWCPRMNLNVAVSDVDAELLGSISPESNIITMPNGVDTDTLVPAHTEAEDGLVFVGGHTWFPNRDGMEHFVEEILPLIRKRRPGVEVTWVGRAPTEVRDWYARHGVRMTGYVEDIRPFVHAAACFVVPLRVGGGTRLKILDAWALGRAVVSTSLGCEGLRAMEGSNILIADRPEEFSDAVCRVLDTPSLRRRLEAGGRATAVELYDWSVVGQGMLRGYQEILTGDTGPSTRGAPGRGSFG